MAATVPSPSRGGLAVRILIAVAVLVAVCPTAAHAYVDFGLGSYALQILVAWALAMAFVLRTFWGRLVAFFRKLLGR
jgi:hypothetical protein